MIDTTQERFADLIFEFLKGLDGVMLVLTAEKDICWRLGKGTKRCSSTTLNLWHLSSLKQSERWKQE